MFALNLTRQREREANAKQSERANREALERKLAREIKREYEKAGIVPGSTGDPFFDVCDETTGEVVNKDKAKKNNKEAKRKEDKEKK